MNSEETESINESPVSWRQQKLFSKILSIILIVLIVACIGAIVYVVKTGQGESFTEFYILGLDSKADNYPTEVILGEEAKVIVGIVNHEYATTTYSVDIAIDGVAVNSIKPFTLENEEKWENVVGFTPAVAGDNQKVEFLLFKQNETDKELYLTLRLFINVK